MKKENVYLIDFGTGSNMYLMPLAISMVGSYSMSKPEIKEHYTIEYRCLRQPVLTLTASMENPVVVGFSCNVWNLKSNLLAAHAVKKMYPHAKIVFGGYSVPSRQKRIAKFFFENSFIDFLIHGEGELSFADLLLQLIEDNRFENIKGLSYRSDDAKEGFFSHTKPERIDNLNDLPSPFLNGTFDKILEQYGSAITGVVWETNRGCPYGCTFCDWGHADVNKVRKFDIQRLNKEIKWISEHEYFYIYLADANFGIFPKRDLKIAKTIAQLRQTKGYPKYVRVSWEKNAFKAQLPLIADIMRKGEVTCTTTLSLQSTNLKTLKAIKRTNLPMDKLQNLKKELHSKCLHTNSELILGLPFETYESFVLGLNVVMTDKLEDSYCIYLCQMLENTGLSTEESRDLYKLKTVFCRSYDANRKYNKLDSELVEVEEFVVETSTISLSDWKRAYVFGYFSIAMYNHRTAFFIINFLNKQYGVKKTDYIDFLINLLINSPEEFPCLSRGLDHITMQMNLVLDGVSNMTALDETGGLVVTPHAAAVILLVKKFEEVYTELLEATKRFCTKTGICIEENILKDVVKYQKAVMPTWPVKKDKKYNFNTNVPEYFQYILMDMDAPELESKLMTISVTDHDRRAEKFSEFAITIVRASLTVDLANVAFDSSIMIDKERLLGIEKKRIVEQAHITKLAEEFQKIV